MPLYLVRLVQVYESFRKAELEALADLAGIPLEFVSYDEDSPFCLVSLSSDEEAKNLISRSILSMAIYSLWGQGKTYPELHASTRALSSHLWDSYKQSSFRFNIDTYRATLSSAEQRALIESFSYMDFEGPIQMINPELLICVFAHHLPKCATPTQLYIGRYIATGGRAAKTTYDLKKRHYISTTSMDAELALITANIAQAAPGKLYYDPFMGTGGFPIACAHFGAIVWGSDIDGRSIKGTGGPAFTAAREEKKAGKVRKRDVAGNFTQYGLSGNYLGAVIGDLTNSPLRGCRAGGASAGGKEIGGWLDGIVCDPPYGIREGLKVLGSKDRLSERERSTHEDRYKEPTYIPPKRAYSFTAILADILTFASDTLAENGRLSMWMPTANDEEDSIELAIPTHPHLELVSVCVQAFNKWSRRLLTYRRLPHSADRIIGSQSETVNENGDTETSYTRQTASDLNNFRRKYFAGFKELEQQKAALEKESQKLALEARDQEKGEGAVKFQEEKKARISAEIAELEDALRRRKLGD